jgi:hypothetical protein
MQGLKLVTDAYPGRRVYQLPLGGQVSTSFQKPLLEEYHKELFNFQVQILGKEARTLIEQ